ncbi:MAG: PD40 domain-containing protein [Candidatus Omnitrophica bacterium]|nr:PD40 domain-containing protein [Candidatus Omnitrophota bacterium]
MQLAKFKWAAYVGLFLPLLIILHNCSPVFSAVPAEKSDCSTVLCLASKYSLLVADLDGSNVSLIKTSSYQDMTHPRVSPDKNWVAYTTYNDLDLRGCGEPSHGYFKTEIRAVQLSGDQDKSLFGPKAGQLNSNAYWIGETNEMTYLSGPATALKFYRSTVDDSMNVVGSPVQIPVVKTVVPMDPQAHLGTDKIVFPGLYNPGGGFVKSIFMMNLSDSQNLVGLSIGRDHAGKFITCADGACANIMENDPKVSPNGKKVAFMRQAPKSGKNGFGWHIFVVDVDKPLQEKDISYSYLGSDLLKNDALPEWIDDETLIFSTIEITSATDFVKNVYTMKADGSQRTKIVLPEGFRYSDVFPFTDKDGTKRMIMTAEKISSGCSK